MPSPSEQGQIKAIGRAIEKAAETAVKTIVREAHAELVEATPKQTGNLRANWVPSVGRPYTGPRAVGHSGARSGAAATVAGLAAVEGYRLTDGKAFIVNRTGYAPDIILDKNDGLVERAVNAAIAAAERTKF